MCATFYLLFDAEAIKMADKFKRKEFVPFIS